MKTTQQTAHTHEAQRSEFTPGPWIIGSHPTHAALIHAENGHPIATVMDQGDNDIGAANAELIVRSVNSHAELLAALSRVTDRLETVLCYHGATDRQIYTHPDINA